MTQALILMLLSGCLVVSTSGDPPNAEVGVYYDCSFVLNGVRRHEDVCGPSTIDPDYVLDHFPYKTDQTGHLIACVATSKLCLFVRDPAAPEPVEPEQISRDLLSSISIVDSSIEDP